MPAPPFSFVLDPPPGIVSDDTPFSSRGRWADSNGIRFKGGKPETVGGEGSSFFGTLNSVNKMMAYTVGSGAQIAAAGAFLYRINVGSGGWTDITPAAGWIGAASDRYSMAMFGDVLLVCKSGGKIFESVGGAVATVVTNAPTQNTAMLSTASRQVMALGTKEEVSGTFNGRAIRWTDTEVRTDWTTTATNLAGEYILPGQQNIVTGCLLGDYVVIWTEGALWLAQFVGDPLETFHFERVADVGIVGIDAWAIQAGTVYWVAPDLTFHSYQVGGVATPVPCPIGRDFLTNCSATNKDRINGCARPRHEEIWFQYPDSRDGGSPWTSRVIAFCVGESARFQTPVWYTHQLARRALVDDPLFASGLSANGTTALAFDAGGNIYAEDCRLVVRSASSWFIRSADQYLDDGRRRVMITRLTPDFEEQASAAVSLTLYCRSFAQGDEVTKGPYSIAAGADKVDFRASGKIISAKFSNETAAALYARFGRQVFDGVTQGLR